MKNTKEDRRVINYKEKIEKVTKDNKSGIRDFVNYSMGYVVTEFGYAYAYSENDYSEISIIKDGNMITRTYEEKLSPHALTKRINLWVKELVNGKNENEDGSGVGN